MGICRTKSETRKGAKGTPGRLVISSAAGYIGEIGDVIEIEGDDPDFIGLRRRWRGKVTSKSDADTTITGRYWIGNRAALATIAGGIQ